MAADIVKLSPQNNNLPRSIQALSSLPGNDSAAFNISDIKVVKSFKTQGGKKRVRFLQSYQGVPILGSVITATQKKQGGFNHFYGDYVIDIQKDISQTMPTLSSRRAVDIAVSRYSSGLSLNQVTNLKTDLYIWLDEKKQAHLIWLISFLEKSLAPARPFFIIDAHQGAILKQWDGINYANAAAGLVENIESNQAKGSGPGGNELTGLYTFGESGRYPAFGVRQQGNTCFLDTPYVSTLDLNYGQGEAAVHQFPCFENLGKAVNGAYSPLNDAHAFAEMTHNLFEQWYGIAPWGEKKITVGVHYSENSATAFYDGKKIVFGDGSDEYHPLTTLSVVAHEIGHGFTEAHSGLFNTAESGGLNESFSDITAAAAHYFVHSTFDWKLGHLAHKQGEAARDMESPKVSHTDKYKKGIGVHTSSGIFNKAFYLLSTTPGWNIKKSFDLYSHANRYYWGVNSTFESAAQGLYLSAKDLGYCVNDLIFSMESVGVYDTGIKDDSGCVSDGNHGPVAQFTYKANDLNVMFISQSTDDRGVASYLWDFGDGSQSTEKNPAHLFPGAGEFKVKLTVGDEQHESDIFQMRLVLSDGSCTAAPWSPAQDYKRLSRVAFEGYIYQARWWNRDKSPATHAGDGKAWKKVGPC